MIMASHTLQIIHVSELKRKQAGFIDCQFNILQVVIGGARVKVHLCDTGLCSVYI